MITAGDEMGRTQLGNNNAYCQDNPTSWIDWKLAEEWSELTKLTSELTELRASSRLLNYDDYLYRSEILDAHGQSLQRYNLAWMNGYSGEMQAHDWQDDGRRLLGMYLSSRTEAMLIWFYSGAHPIQIVMPGGPWGWDYKIVSSTADPGELAHDQPAARRLHGAARTHRRCHEGQSALRCQDVAPGHRITYPESRQQTLRLYSATAAKPISAMLASSGLSGTTRTV